MAGEPAERFEQDEGGRHRGVVNDEEMGRRRWTQADPASGSDGLEALAQVYPACPARGRPRPSWTSISKSAMPFAGSDRRMVYRRRRARSPSGNSNKKSCPDLCSNSTRSDEPL